MTPEQIEAVADYFTGSAVADASIRLAMGGTPLGDLSVKIATKFFAARTALGLEGYATKEAAIALLSKL